MNEPTVSQPVIQTTEPKSMPQFKSEWNPATATGSIPGSALGSISPPAGDSATGQQEPSSGGSTASSDLTGDAEGVWSVDIDQAFQEALTIYPPCGRRKIIISDEGKMYGRNELIARYIKLRCGKTRTRKQVSSHIQVLARKKLRDEQAKKKADTSTVSVTTPSTTSASTSSSSQSPVAPPPAVTTTAQTPRIPMPQFPHLPGLPAMPVPSMPQPMPTLPPAPLPLADAKEFINKAALLPTAAAMYQQLWQQNAFVPNLAYNPDLTKPFGADFAALAMVQAPIKSESPDGHLAITSSKLTLNGFNAYVEMPTGERTDIVTIPDQVNKIENMSIKAICDRYPPLLNELYAKGPRDAFFLAKCWANVKFPPVESSMLFAVDSRYKAPTRFDIQVSTKVCSFANQVVEKVEVYPAEENNGEFEFRCERSPMCEYMVQFISELMKLDEDQWKNNVLENFNVLQVVTNKQTGETLMVMCFDFEVNIIPQPACSIFKLIP